MKLSSNMMRFHSTFGIRRTFELFAEAGVQGMDFNTDVAEYCTQEHDQQFYEELGNFAREQGVIIGQAHAPFPSSYADEDKNAKRFAEIVQGMRNASYLGAPMIVVHPCTHLDYTVEGNAERMFEFNLDFYRRLIPYAREFDIKIAIENISRYSVTSTPENLNKLYDTLNDPVFTICFDVGHCLLQEVDPAEAIGKIGERLADGCTHIHDNYANMDAHSLPFYGVVNWESVMKALADIGYRGNLNYEAAGFLARVPDALCIAGLAYMAQVGHYLIGRFEYYKNRL